MKFLEFDSLGSTNAKALELFQSGERGPFWVRADQQTAGRGRRGREWASPKGNLYASGLYPWTRPIGEAGLLSFVATASLVQTLQAYALTTQPQVKWPNDVLVGGSKISGILLENVKGAVIIGMGVNLIGHPEDTPYPATHLLEHIAPAAMAGPEPIYTGAAPFLALLASNFDQLFQAYLKDGFAPIRQAWLSHAPAMPRLVTVRLAREEFSGQAMDVLQNGALRVRLDDGSIRDVYAGDVFYET